MYLGQIEKMDWQMECDASVPYRAMTVQVGFSHAENEMDETEFCINAHDAKELTELFEGFCKENGFQDVSIESISIARVAATLDELTKMEEMEASQGISECKIRDVIQKFKDLAQQYGFEIVQDNEKYSLCAKEKYDEKWTPWINYYSDKDEVCCVGNTDNMNIWLCDTRKDLTPEMCVQFVDSLNEVFALSGDDKFFVRELIDPEDWQEIANVRDASEDIRYVGSLNRSLDEKVKAAKSEKLKDSGKDTKKNEKEMSL